MTPVCLDTPSGLPKPCRTLVQLDSTECILVNHRRKKRKHLSQVFHDPGIQKPGILSHQ